MAEILQVESMIHPLMVEILEVESMIHPLMVEILEVESMIHPLMEEILQVESMIHPSHTASAFCSSPPPKWSKSSKYYLILLSLRL